VAQRRRFVLTLLAAILGLCTLGAPPPAGAAKSPVAAPPTHLRPVQSKADCAAALSLLAAICGTAVTEGDLQLIWDESDKTVTGYKVYRVDGGGHQLLGTSTARYYLVKKLSEGYANLCFAVQATVGSQSSADSARYCYRPGATATTRSFKPSRTVTQVAWTAPANVNCGGSSLTGSTYFQAADTDYGSAFTAFFPFLPNEQPTSGRVGVSGMYAGNEAAIFAAKVHYSSLFGAPFCSGVSPYTGGDLTAQINSVAAMTFNLGELARHKLYSAMLTLKASQTLVFRSGKATFFNSGWCAVVVGAADREWWLAPLGNMTYGKAGRMPVASKPPAALDITPIVSSWASYGYRTNYGLIVADALPPGAKPMVSSACMTKFSTPSLQVVYF